jgi:hypothetical protein
MWIFPVPISNLFCLSAPVVGDSISASDWRCRMLEQSAMWRSKYQPSAAWSRTWKRWSWTRPLFGRICEPSTGIAGVAQWTELLVATRASRSASPESSEARRIPDTCGLPSRTASTSCNPNGASSKTSPTICASDSVTSPEHYTRWAIALRRACLLRRKSGRHINENDCSSWPTVKVASGDYSYANGDHNRPVLNLEGAAKLWRTPLSLNQGETGNIAGQNQLGVQVRGWSTPRASDTEKGGPQQHFGAGGTPLPAQAVGWATPTSRDHKDGADPSPAVPTNSLLGRQAPRMMSRGNASSNSSPTLRRQLNPTFVEWLMGWPLGWTDFGYWGTAWSLNKPLTRSVA